MLSTACRRGIEKSQFTPAMPVSGLGSLAAAARLTAAPAALGNESFPLRVAGTPPVMPSVKRAAPVKLTSGKVAFLMRPTSSLRCFVISGF